MRYTIHTNYTFLLYNAQYAAQRGAHTVHCPYMYIHVHTIHISTKIPKYHSQIQWEGQEHPWKVSNPSKSTTYPIYRGVRVKPLTPTTGSHSYLSTGPREAGCLSSGVGQAGWRAHPPTSLSLFHTHY